MGNSQSTSLAPGEGKAFYESLGYKEGRKPLRLNLQRQYLIKEYLQLHGGHGPNASAKQVFLGLGVAFALTFAWTGFQKVAFHHSVPKTLAPEYKSAEAEWRRESQARAISDHKVGEPVKATVWDVAAEKEKIESGDEE